MQYAHEETSGQLCPHCGDSFQRSNSLKRHIFRVHEKKKPFKCLVCESTFASRSDLKKHILRMHKDGKLKPVTNFKYTDYFNMKFASKGNFKVPDSITKSKSNSNSEGEESNNAEFGGHFMSETASNLPMLQGISYFYILFAFSD